MKRSLDILVLSDIHLGTYGSRAKELLLYLESVAPKILILNGDIVDIWQFKKSYFPQDHLKVIKKIIDMSSTGTEVHYITGNHDEMLRKFTDLKLGNIKLSNKLLLSLNNQKVWIFHGDVFDASIHHSKWLAKLGGWGYDKLIQLNNVINYCLDKMGKEKYSLSKKIKNSVKKAVKYISDFEHTATELAIEKNYDFVICGHIHQPQIKEVITRKGTCTYMNSGDWIENLSSLEYKNGEWKLFYFEENKEQILKNKIIDTPLFSLEDLKKIVISS
ncbi:UDP-2,3-diacylglucosamine diphosphatase [Sphingobacterium sp. ML3W]|jgi:UDP-2,3-diacylglucosamine pyrophosphatase LpxH|uniref:UDP-2,3-diacylglucosamine pyrophosphatase LpxH n=2 Tax=Sphingobacterium TaxID=28453 RepID=A0A420AQN4_SPHD1|nr:MULTISPECIES: UDP-2,3-diacylglucosamine diphosphatase [Sphingobacterium]MDF2517892.1 phosphoesterase [Sphingobacterium sp.]MCS4225294.1 UDP-2,3-diacylglucosamine pyrophosphatase LpxH [Sphingobacterium sp. BIGb0165]MDR2273762.1 UDP-2,3-diacylglucosamine diphosphatase [Sphingobacterium sp.]QIH35228.1 UDP-2,3-diacylglucosamine diphosphatase [Sphingobacterium sp. DR205]RKE46703.1 UDP-2,3-diacylglucosamine pyrophosphatase LpxH [Sphingobacterium detergens]